MHASLFALFMPFTVSAPNVNRDYISLWNIPHGSRKLLSLSPQFSFPAPQTQTEEMWSNFSFVMIFKPKTVLAMANYALVEPKREATFVSRAVASAPLDRKLASKESFFSGVKYKGGHIGHIFLLFSRILSKTRLKAAYRGDKIENKALAHSTPDEARLIQGDIQLNKITIT